VTGIPLPREGSEWTMSRSAARAHDDPAHEGERSAGADDRERTSREGGDAEAAGSVEEREDVARDEDDTWSPDDRG
jgi:hypothetical protein